MSADGQGSKWRRNIAKNFNRLSSAHKRYTRQTDGRQHIANVNVSSHTLKTKVLEVASRNDERFNAVRREKLHFSETAKYFAENLRAAD